MTNNHQHIKGGPLDYNYIADGIYVGTNQCCALSLDEVLKKEGISADISLEDVRLDNPFGVDMYAWIPTQDHEAPTRDQLDFGVAALKELVRQKRKVYVHCKNGHGRGPTLVAAYFIASGKTAADSIEAVRRARPVIHLEDAQRKALEIFATRHGRT